jgi:hypothetical protein
MSITWFIPNIINNMVGVSEQFDLTLILKVLDIELRFKVKKLF